MLRLTLITRFKFLQDSVINTVTHEENTISFWFYFNRISDLTYMYIVYIIKK